MGATPQPRERERIKGAMVPALHRRRAIAARLAAAAEPLSLVEKGEMTAGVSEAGLGTHVELRPAKTRVHSNRNIFSSSLARSPAVSGDRARLYSTETDPLESTTT
jgi:hypothetical protein